MPPMITPFKENGDIDFDAFVNNIEKWNHTPLAGYLVLGSNSETPFLSEEEKLELIRLTVSAAAPGKHIMAGCGLESIRETIRLTNKAAALGAQSALLLTPGFFQSEMTTEALVDYYTQVADQAEIPVLLYNVPKFARTNMGAEAVARLSEHPNIIGMKDSSGNLIQLAGFLNAAAEDFNVMVGTAGAWYPALTLGVEAGIHALANCCPDECVRIQALYEEDALEKAKNLYLRMLPVNTAVTATFGIAGLKYACDLMGYQGGFVRSPLQQLSEERKQSLRAVFVRAGLI